MGKVLGKVTDAVGLTDYKGQEEAAKQAGFASAQQYQLTKESIALQKETLEFQKSQYEDWQAIYGDIQTNLGDYYKNLTGEKITALGLENQQREYQAAVAQLEKEAAQRGISGSGLEYATQAAMTYQNAEQRAAIRASADQKVAEQQLSFLGVGLGQGQNMLGNINTASGNVGAAYSAGIQGFSNQYSSANTAYTSRSATNQDTVGTMWGNIAGSFL